MKAKKTVFITGASSGIGAAVAREYGRRGANLVLVARRVERLEALCARFAAEGVQAIAVPGDITKDGDMERAVEAGIRKFGGIDVFLANAGFGVVGDVEKASLDDYRRQFETNVFGVLRTIKAAIPELRRRRGRIGVVGSLAGIISMPNMSPYAASKFAVRAITQSLHDELKPDGVKVTLISPGFVASDIRRTDNDGQVHEGAKDPIPSWIIAPVEPAARAIVRALERGAREIVITYHGKAIVFLYRHFPWLVHFIFGLGLRGRVEPT